MLTLSCTFVSNKGKRFLQVFIPWLLCDFAFFIPLNDIDHYHTFAWWSNVACKQENFRKLLVLLNVGTKVVRHFDRFDFK